MTSRGMLFFSKKQRAKMEFDQPGKPTQNDSVKSFNARFRDQCLNPHWFRDIYEASESIESWKQHRNDGRLHSSHVDTPTARLEKQAALPSTIFDVAT